MKFIAVAPNVEYLSWQVDLAAHKFLKCGYDKEDNCVLYPTQNHPWSGGDHISPNIHKTDVKPWWEFLNIEHRENLAPICIQTSLKQIDLNPSTTYCLLDPDMFPIKHSVLNVPDGLIIHDNVYEKWHMRMHDENSFFKSMVDNKFNFSGFVPIIINGYTLSKILDDWIDLHIQCYWAVEDDSRRWWAGMYSYNLACAKHGVNVIEKQLCGIPGYHSSLTEEMLFIHYSVDNSVLNKKNWENELTKSNLDARWNDEINSVDYEFLCVLCDWYLKSTTHA
jgi:hypothetical protein